MTMAFFLSFLINITHWAKVKSEGFACVQLRRSFQMKKLSTISIALVAALAIGLSGNVFAGHQDMKKNADEHFKESKEVAHDLLNETGGALNRAVGDAANAVKRVGQHVEDGFDKMKDKVKGKK